MEIHFSEQALNSLDDLLHFLKYKQRLPANQIKRIKNSILNRIKELKSFPLQGQIEPLLTHSKIQYRRIIVGHTKVVYRLDEDSIIIISVFDSRQSPDKMKP